MLTALTKLVTNVNFLKLAAKEALDHINVHPEVHKRDEETEVDWPDEKHAQSCS